MDDTLANATMEAARIPQIFKGTRLSTLQGASEVSDYTRSEMFKDDIKNSRGVMISGDSHQRVKVFIAFARASCLMTRGVVYITMPSLMLAVTEDNHPLYETISGAKGLFVGSMFDHTIPMALSGEQRMFVEEYLSNRSSSGLRNYFSLSRPIEHADWWSGSFRKEQADCSRSFEV